MKGDNYALENLHRVMELPEDYPNRQAIINHWRQEYATHKMVIEVEKMLNSKGRRL